MSEAEKTTAASSASPLREIHIRDGEQSDWNLVRKTWLRTYSRSAWARSFTAPAEWNTGKTAPAYWTGHHELIDRLLYGGSLIVATWPEDIWSVIGWCCWHGDTLHYVYVHQDYRRENVARRLLEHAGFGRKPHAIYSHRSRGASRLPIPAHWTFDPYAAFLRPEGA